MFLEGAGLRVECDGDGELSLACKLSAEDHNLWQTSEDTHACVQDTDRIEQKIQEHMQEPADEEDDAPREEEDISLLEWAQLGYKWFKRDEVTYI